MCVRPERRAPKDKSRYEWKIEGDKLYLVLGKGERKIYSYRYGASFCIIPARTITSLGFEKRAQLKGK